VLRKRRAIWLGLVGVVVPLAVMLALQYYWLVDLEKTSGIARHATLQKFLQVVDKEIYYYYASLAERTLNVPSSMITEERIRKVGWTFKKARPVGVKRLFLVSYRTPDSLLFYDEPTGSLIEPAYSNETLAVWAATAPYNILAKTEATIEECKLSVDERSPGFVMILNPITDEQSHLVAVAGMVLDQDFLEQAVLKKAIQATLPKISKRDEFAVTVVDGQGRVVMTTDSWVPPGGPSEKKELTARQHLSFVFTNWTISLRDRHRTPERWARRNFTLNMSMSVALAVVLLGGVVFALRMASRELRLSEMKSDFVSNVSHELRTPIASIRVFAELMRAGKVKDPGKVQEYGEFIEAESRRLTQLVNNILDFSRIESGRKEYEFAEVDLSDLVAETVTTFAMRTRNNGFHIRYRPPEQGRLSARVDRGAIDQALSNLLDNAVKYSGESRTVDVSLGRDGDEALIEVSDEGIGISPEEQRKVFERFHRVSTGAVHDVRGSGLGLAIVHHIVAAHGGTVTVRSQLGQGSTFTIRLPMGVGSLG